MASDPRHVVCCALCGRAFTPRQSNAVTCSPACRQKAYRQRRAEPLPAPPEQAGPSADTLWMLMLVQILGIGDGR